MSVAGTASNFAPDKSSVSELRSSKSTNLGASDRATVIEDFVKRNPSGVLVWRESEVSCLSQFFNIANASPDDMLFL